MIRHLTFALLLAVFAAVGPQQATAQDVSVTEAAISDVEIFDRLAQRAEDLVSREEASIFAISRLRAELVTWRDRFSRQTTVNAARIETVDAQLAALGAVPESGEEASSVAARRAALITQRQELVAPRLLAQESFARANGLISEFDALVLRRETAALTVRGPSPLSPTNIGDALGAVWSVVGVIGIEIGAGFAAERDSGRLAQALPRALVLFIVGVGLLGMGRRLVTRWRAGLAQREGRWRPLILFLLTLVQITVPLVGLLALTEALQSLGIFGLRGSDVVEAIPLAGFFVIFGWWISRHVFPTGDLPGYLGYDAKTRASGRRYSVTIAWVLAIATVVDAALRTMDMTEGAATAVAFPVLVLLGLMFWRLGRVIQTPPEPVEGATQSAGRMRALVGRFCSLAALVAPSVAAFGFVDAGRALLIPAIMSVALVGVLLLLQRIVHTMTQTAETEEDLRGVQALVPIFASFTIYLLSLPLFALIWGARVDDLLELWSRFREGFAIGETRISPTDFLMFAAVFAVGYLLTRFIQGTLRKTVLPRT
ncbi:MAG: DUF3772 domain-containing protein, partial [Paracoccaceae bacterium]|nr:DUF3772 domain-containing protein [Paracoccaceae bacterium]